jgi:hypothetical protein
VSFSSVFATKIKGEKGFFFFFSSLAWSTKVVFYGSLYHIYSMKNALEEDFFGAFSARMKDRRLWFRPLLLA